MRVHHASCVDQPEEQVAGAQTKGRGAAPFTGMTCKSVRSRNDLPVPALPVKNTLRPSSTASSTSRCSASSASRRRWRLPGDNARSPASAAQPSRDRLSTGQMERSRSFTGEISLTSSGGRYNLDRMAVCSHGTAFSFPFVPGARMGALPPAAAAAALFSCLRAASFAQKSARNSPRLFG
jgi:hypothetical protein